MSEEAKPSTGECQICGRGMRLTKTGRVWVHSSRQGWPPSSCAGSKCWPEGHPEALSTEPEAVSDEQ